MRRGNACLLAGAVIVLAVAAANHNSLSGPFVFDDRSSIVDNPTLDALWPPGRWLHPPTGAGVGGRPVLNLSFALNHAVSGMDVWSYHALNLVIHALAGLTLFGIVRRTLRRPVLGGRYEASALPLALVIALIWSLHPVQTASVTYLSQRAESLMGLFYLLTLGCFLRSVEERPTAEHAPVGLPARFAWQTAAVVVCSLGMATKEVMVTAPVVVLLYDRLFVGASWREVWGARRWFHGALFCTWILLACLMSGLNARGAGFGLGYSGWSYARVECQVVLRYLGLALWPHPLVFDYGPDPVVGSVWPSVAGLGAILTLALLLLRRRPRLAFALLWFGLILAPTSSLVPVANEPMAENRLYLPLAGVVVLGVLGMHAWVGRRGWVVAAVVIVGCGFLTERRNEAYRSEVGLWRDTVRKSPDNAGAHNNLGSALMRTQGRLAEAISEFRTASRLMPDDAGAHNNLANALVRLPGGWPEAITEYRAALRIVPGSAIVHRNLAKAYMNLAGSLPAAVAEFRVAANLDPGDASVRNDLGRALARTPGGLPEALTQYRAALRIDPGLAPAHNNLGLALLGMGRLDEAIGEYQAAVRLDPGRTAPRINLASALARAGRRTEAIGQYEWVVRLDPGNQVARAGLAGLQSGPNQE